MATDVKVARLFVATYGPWTVKGLRIILFHYKSIFSLIFKKNAILRKSSLIFASIMEKVKQELQAVTHRARVTNRS